MTPPLPYVYAWEDPETGDLLVDADALAAVTPPAAPRFAVHGYTVVKGGRACDLAITSTASFRTPIGGGYPGALRVALMATRDAAMWEACSRAIDRPPGASVVAVARLYACSVHRVERCVASVYRAVRA